MAQLAIEGGRPVRETVLPYGRQSIDDDDVAAVAAVLRSDWLTTGPNVNSFEEAFADAVGAKFAVAVSNGTAALHAAVYAAGIGQHDEAIVPCMTFAASANCVRYVGGTVVFSDVQPRTLNVDPTEVQKLLTPRTKAVISVDFGGQPPDMDELAALARAQGAVLIDDASHALGGTYHRRRVGSIADLTTFSLHPVKSITAGEGGVVTTNNPDFAARMRQFRNHGINADHRQRTETASWYYEITDLGYNYRITDFQCALAASQLTKLPHWVQRRRAIAARYAERLAGLPEVTPPAVLDDRESGWHLYVVQLDFNLLKVDRAQVFRALRAENIGVNVHYIPVPWHPYYQNLGYTKGQWPVAEAAYERVLSLPMFPAMTDADVDDVTTGLAKVLDHYRI